MSMSFRGRLLAATVCAGVLGAAAAPAGAETLADAVALAYQNNPTLEAQRAVQRALDETYVQARSGWRPTLNANASMTYNQTRIPKAAGGAPIDVNGDGIPDILQHGIFESNSARIGLTFTQPLWTGGRVAAAVNAANYDVLAGQENLRRVEAQVLTSVIQVYSDVRRDQEALAIQRTNVEVLTRQLQESQARFDVGELTRTDVAQSQARLAQGQSLLQSAIAQLAISRASYATLVGQNPGDLAPQPSLAYLLPKDVDEAYKLAEEFNPQLRAQQFAEQASRARVAGARAERMPNVSGQVTYGFNGPAIPNRPLDPFQSDLYNRGVTATLSASVPLFNGGLTSSRIRQAIERNNTDRINIEAVRRTTLQSITQFWSQLIAARSNISSSDEQVRASRIASEGTHQEQQVGLRTTIDVLNAEQELRSAELSAITSRRDEYVAAANVLATTGRLEAKDLIPAVKPYDATKNFRRLRLTWGWVPWEEPISKIDQYATPFPSRTPEAKPQEAPIGPGLEPPPAVVAPPATVKH
ncbi:MAG TPA: TolC family outer membrane protein [Phenylobacterium sp.]|nr:TolC family outer membrane protein [Phenylobacterium sp.]